MQQQSDKVEQKGTTFSKSLSRIKQKILDMQHKKESASKTAKEIE
jgi:hypothetical protein